MLLFLIKGEINLLKPFYRWPGNQKWGMIWKSSMRPRPHLQPEKKISNKCRGSLLEQVCARNYKVFLSFSYFCYLRQGGSQASDNSTRDTFCQDGIRFQQSLVKLKKVLDSPIRKLWGSSSCIFQPMHIPHLCSLLIQVTANSEDSCVVCEMIGLETAFKNQSGRCWLIQTISGDLYLSGFHITNA